MVLCTSPYRLVALLVIIVVVWLLVSAGVLPADVAASLSFIVILYTLVPVGKWSGQSQERHD